MWSFNNLLKMPPFKRVNWGKKITCLALSLLIGKEQSWDSIPDTVAPEPMHADRLNPLQLVTPVLLITLLTTSRWQQWLSNWALSLCWNFWELQMWPPSHPHHQTYVQYYVFSYRCDIGSDKVETAQGFVIRQWHSQGLNTRLSSLPSCLPIALCGFLAPSLC